MKKLLSIALILIFALSLSACGKKTEPSSSTKQIDGIKIDLGQPIIEKPQPTKTTKTATSDTEMDITEDDLKKLKTDINNIEIDDLNALSQ